MAFALSLLTAGRAAAGLGPLDMASYPQTIHVLFKSEEAAQKASLQIAPLYHDLQAAFSTRWDDNQMDDLRVREIMEKYGQKGTFYLADPSEYVAPSETGVVFEGDPKTGLSKALLKGGNSIGGHTLSHEFLPSLSKNRAFREVMGVRVAREVDSQSPLLSFTYPFVAFQSEGGGEPSRKDIEEMLKRSGYYQYAESHYNQGRDSGLLDGVFFACDGQEGGWGVDIQDELNRARNAKDRPLFLITMHAWQQKWGGPDYPLLAAFYEKWGKNPNWWYCNQNEYGAYRYQALHSTFTTRVEGKILVATLTRPDPRDLNDPTPLSFLVTGVGRKDVQDVRCQTAEAESFEKQGAYAFDLGQDRGRNVPEVYGKVENPENSDDPAKAATAPEIPGVKALLSRKDDFLTLVLVNEGQETLRNVRAKLCLPLRWKRIPDLVVGNLTPGTERTIPVPLSGSSDDFLYASDREYLVAQVDFRSGKQTRLFVTCNAEGVKEDTSYPRDGFLVLGPLPKDRQDFDFAGFTSKVLNAKEPALSFDLPFEGQKVAWKAPAADQAAFLDPDIIWTTGKSASATFYTWDPALYYKYGFDLHYILWGQVHSPEGRKVLMETIPNCVEKVMLNGKEVMGKEMKLRKGANDLRLLYVPVGNQWSCFSERNYGAWFRLVDEAGNRMENVKFERPTQKK